MTTPAIRSAVVRALAGAQAQAQNAAANVMARAMASWPDGAEVVELAESLLGLGGERAAPFVRKRADASSPALRSELEILLAKKR